MVPYFLGFFVFLFSSIQCDLSEEFKKIDEELDCQFPQLYSFYLPQHYNGVENMVAMGQKIAHRVASAYLKICPEAVIYQGTNDLHEKGVEYLGEVISHQEVNEIRNYLENQVVYHGHTIRDLISPRKKPVPFSQFRGNVCCYDPGVIIKCPHLMKIASSEMILRKLEEYFQCPVTLYDFNVLWTFGSHGVHNWHRDFDDFKQVTLFIYLTDVEDESYGPHVYMMGTQFGKEEGFTYPIVGKAGTGFLADSLGVHKGLTPLPGKSRLIFWARYGLGKNYVYRQNGSFRDLESVYHIDFKDLSQNLSLEAPHEIFLWRLFLN